MAERIQLNIQLPLEELGRFSRLVDQLLQMMTAAEAGGTGKRETEDSPSFDLARFQELMAREASFPEQAPAIDSAPQPAVNESGDLPPASGTAAEMSHALEAPVARAEVSHAPEAPVAQAEVSRLTEAPAVQSEISFLEAAPSAKGDISPLADPVTAQAEVSPLPEIFAGQIEASLQQIQIPTATPEDSAALPEPPDPSQKFAQEEGELAPPPDSEARETAFQELTAPVAGYYPEVQLPEAPGGIWSDVKEELTYTGPAPLTAEAVSLAFQRDDRRYDNGFPLY